MRALDACPTMHVSRYFPYWDIIWKHLLLCMLNLWLPLRYYTAEAVMTYISVKPIKAPLRPPCHGTLHDTPTFAFCLGCSFWGIHPHPAFLECLVNFYFLGNFSYMFSHRYKPSALNWMTMLESMVSIIINCLFEWHDEIVDIDKMTFHWLLCHTRQ